MLTQQLWSIDPGGQSVHLYQYCYHGNREEEQDWSPGSSMRPLHLGCKPLDPAVLGWGEWRVTHTVCVGVWIMGGVCVYVYVWVCGLWEECVCMFMCGCVDYGRSVCVCVDFKHVLIYICHTKHLQILTIITDIPQNVHTCSKIPFQYQLRAHPSYERRR